MSPVVTINDAFVWREHLLLGHYKTLNIMLPLSVCLMQCIVANVNVYVEIGLITKLSGLGRQPKKRH